MVDGEIIAELQQAVTAAVAASDSPSLPVKYIDIGFDVPNDQKWLEIIFIPNNEIGGFWGNEKNYRGILRLVLHWPNASLGPYAPMDLLKSISDHFSKGLALQTVKIYEIPDFTGSIEDGDEILYPVTIRYQSYRS